MDLDANALISIAPVVEETSREIPPPFVPLRDTSIHDAEPSSTLAGVSQQTSRSRRGTTAPSKRGHASAQITH